MNAFDQFDQILQQWIADLESYSLPQLQCVPAAGQWSMGQLYQHLVNDTEFYFEQATTALSSTQTGDANDAGREMLRNNAFPDIRIEGHPSNAFIPQPVSKHSLLNGLQTLQLKANVLQQRIEMEQGDGKSLHPGLGYFSAVEWCQFASMHLLHHRRQKQRIDAFLSTLINGTEGLFAHDAT